MKALSEKNHSVFVVDITQQLEVARAMRVLATPSRAGLRAMGRAGNPKREYDRKTAQFQGIVEWR